MDAHVIVALVSLLQTVTPPPLPSVPPAPTPANQVVVTATPAPKCDARAWQRLVGRTISDLLTISLPAGTRIYRIGDPPSKAVVPGQLSVEIARSTRVRRVYCS
jgi:hypothetical protein